MNSDSRDSVHKHESLRWAASDGTAAERHGDWSDAAAAYQEAADLDYAIAHFACHAHSNTGEPLESGVQLAADQWLRVHEIMQLSLARSPHVVLSACETAGIGQTAPDEGVGLPAAFLQAGAKGVIASSWPVHDDSTSLLMVRLYDEIQRSPDDFPLALSRAQAWPRKASHQVLADAARRYGMNEPAIPPGDAPYAHPFFWAAFEYTG